MLIHALAESLRPIHEAFNTHWPEAETYDLLDTSLSADHAAGQGILDDRMIERFQTLGRYAAASGAGGRETQGILFTCSAFGPAIDAVKRELKIPVLKPNEAAFAQALTAGRRIGLLVTFEPSLPSLSAELQAMARLEEVHLELEARFVPKALAALHEGKPLEHDELIARTAAELPQTDAIVLGQFSMARSARAVSLRVTAPVITTPESAVLELRRLLAGA
jgi:Asp/Glu/hydantoin racemase